MGNKTFRLNLEISSMFRKNTMEIIVFALFIIWITQNIHRIQVE